VLETPQTVYFLRKHVGDIVEITMRELRKLAEALPGQLTGVYDDDFRSFYSEYFGVDAPPAYKCP
jgi:hypothetical protein